MDVGKKEIERKKHACAGCGGFLYKHLQDIKQTRLYVCASCWMEHIEFIKKDKCKHKFTKGDNTCIHCGKKYA